MVIEITTQLKKKKDEISYKEHDYHIFFQKSFATAKIWEAYTVFSSLTMAILISPG